MRLSIRTIKVCARFASHATSEPTSSKEWTKQSRKYEDSLVEIITIFGRNMGDLFDMTVLKNSLHKVENSSRPVCLVWLLYDLPGADVRLQWKVKAATPGGSGLARAVPHS